MRFLPTAALVALLPLASCVLFDSGGPVEIDPPGTLYAVSELRLTARGRFRSVRIAIDGQDLEGLFPANSALRIPFVGVADGEHRVVVTAADTSVPRSATRTLVVENSPRLLAVIPPPGAVTTGEPFAIEATFSGPVMASLAAAAAVVRGPNGNIPARGTALAGGNTVRVEIDAPLDLAGPVNVVLSSGESGDGARIWSLGPWFAPPVGVAFDAPASDVATNGPIDVIVRPIGTILPASLELRAGDTVLASLGPPGWSYRWETTTVPEGIYPLTLRARGYVVSAPARHVTVDRTPPHVTSCGPDTSPADDTWVQGCVTVTFDEPLVNLAPALRVGGVARSLSPPGGRWAPGSLQLCPGDRVTALPATQSLDLGPATDAAGNPVTAFACTMELQAWHGPCGSGPVGLGGTAIIAGEIALAYTTPGSSAGLSCDVLWLSPGGDAIGRAAAKDATGWTTAVAPRGMSPGSSLAGLVWGKDVAAWTESGWIGTSVLSTGGTWGMRILLGQAGWARPAVASTGDVVAWAAPTSQGGSAIRARIRDPYFGTWSLDGPPIEDPAAVAASPSVAFGASDDVLLGWIENPAAGGPAQVRAALRALSGWSSFGATLNLDPARSAAEPAVWSSRGSMYPKFIAWSENGQVLLRQLDFSVGPPQVMNSGPGRVARSPRFMGVVYPVLVFVEEGAAGDEIRMASWDPAGWTSSPAIANAGLPGPVTGLAVAGDAGVAWLDGAGAIRVRVVDR